MNGVLAVARRELKTFFASPIAYIVLGGFLLLAGWLYFSTLFLAGQASLRGFFSIAPVLFVVLVPAITMRSIAEERKSGTLELLLTMPLQHWQVVVGKFLAALGMVAVGLAFTVPYALTVRSLTATGSTFDWGPVVAGYVGLLLLASSLIAMGLLASAVSKNQIVGFVVGLLVSFAFYFVDKFAVLMPTALAPIAEFASIDYHFENIARGVFDSRDVVFYLSLTAAGLLLTSQALVAIRQERRRSNLLDLGVPTLATLGCLVLLNVLSIRAFARVDVTADGAYTLSKATKETLAGLDDAVTVTAYFTQELPAPYSSNARYVRDLLEEFRAASKGKLSFEFIDPAASETEADKETKREVKQDIFGRRFREPTAQEKELAASGIQAVEIRVVEADQQQTRRAYLGLVLRHHEKKEVIPVVQNLSSLEYDLTSLVRKLTRPKTPVIGLLQGHDEPKLDEKLRQLQALLSQMYEVRPVTLAPGKDAFDADLDALFVLGPKKAVPETELKAIDALVMAGRPVAFFLDTVQVDLRTFEQTPAEHGVGQLLAGWGITLTDQLVADVTSASLNVSERRGFMVVNQPVPYPFIPVVKRLEGDSPVSKGLGEVTFPFASRVTASASDGREVVVLARSSAKSWLESKPQNLDPRRDWRAETITPTGPYELMVQVSGRFKSSFGHETKGDSRLIVAGTSALLQDDFMGRPNQALALNIADWLLLDPALLAMRTRGIELAQLKTELPDSTRNAAKFGNALGLPLGLALLGLVRWRLREGRRLRVAL